MMKNCVMGLRSKLANRKENNKGFTLVELIVVIVILAILAAILIPGLMKWIDEARDKQYQLEAKSIYMAAEGVVAKKYGSDGNTGVDSNNKLKLSDVELDEVEKLSGLGTDKVRLVEYQYDTNNEMILEFTTEFTSTNEQKVKALWKDGEWSITKMATP